MMVSTRGRYALRILIDIAEHQAQGYIPLKELAQRQEISEKYLESIVKDLVKGGILEGLRGKGGGYRLRTAPDQFTVYEILEQMEGCLAPVACLKQDAAACPRMAHCRTYPLWEGLDEVIRSYLSRFTLEDLTRSSSEDYDYII